MIAICSIASRRGAGSGRPRAIPGASPTTRSGSSWRDEQEQPRPRGDAESNVLRLGAGPARKEETFLSRQPRHGNHRGAGSLKPSNSSRERRAALEDLEIVSRSRTPAKRAQGNGSGPAGGRCALRPLGRTGSEGSLKPPRIRVLPRSAVSSLQHLVCLFIA